MGATSTYDRQIIRNRARCRTCNTTIESVHRHDFQVCKCDQGVFVDGGKSYIRRGWPAGMEPNEAFEELSEWDPPLGQEEHDGN